MAAPDDRSRKSACMSICQQGPRASARMPLRPCITEAGASARFRRLAPSLRLLLLLSTAPGYSSGLLAHLALGVYMPDADTLSEALRLAKHISDIKNQLV